MYQTARVSPSACSQKALDSFRWADGLLLTLHRRVSDKLMAIMPESNTLSPKPRRVLSWVWMIMMVTALLAAIGRAVFG